MSIVQISLLLTLLLSLNVYASESESCLEPMNQQDMNQWAGADYQNAEAELYRVITEIKKHIKVKESFLLI